MRAPHLLAAWAGYWVGLAVTALWPALMAARRVTGPDGHGSIDGSMGDGRLRLTVADQTTTLWTGSASIGSLILWIAAPPLIMWIIWLLTRPREAPTPQGGDPPHRRRSVV
jgi:hypothetical protein